MKQLTIKATKGLWNRKTKSTFGYISSYLEELGCDTKDQPKKETIFTAEPLQKDSTFTEMFGTLTTFWTKEQIVEVIKNHEGLLNKSWWNFFPYQNNTGDRFVLRVYFYASKWGLYVDELALTDVWSARYEHVLFVPQQIASESLKDSLTLDDTLSLAIETLKKAGYKVIKEM